MIADKLTPYLRAGAARGWCIDDGIAPPAESAPARPAAFGAPLGLCLVGGIDPRKGQDVAVAALAELRRQGFAATLELVGRDVDERFAASVREDARRLGAAGDVEFVGEVDDVDVRLANADIAIREPSRDEWTPLVLMEALAHATPGRGKPGRSGCRDCARGRIRTAGRTRNRERARLGGSRALVSDPAGATAMAERGRDLIRGQFSIRGTLRAWKLRSIGWWLPPTHPGLREAQATANRCVDHGGINRDCDYNHRTGTRAVGETPGGTTSSRGERIHNFVFRARF